MYLFPSHHSILQGPLFPFQLVEEGKICHWQILHCIAVISLIHEFLLISSSPKKLIELGGLQHMAGELLGRWLGAFG
jgi:hypothetical protein